MEREQPQNAASTLNPLRQSEGSAVTEAKWRKRGKLPQVSLWSSQNDLRVLKRIFSQCALSHFECKMAQAGKKPLQSTTAKSHLKGSVRALKSAPKVRQMDQNVAECATEHQTVTPNPPKEKLELLVLASWAANSNTSCTI